MAIFRGKRFIFSPKNCLPQALPEVSMRKYMLNRITRTAELIATLLCIIMFLEVILLLGYFFIN